MRAGANGAGEAAGASSEFRVENAYVYDQRSPLRWIWSHLRRNIWLLVAFLAASLLISVGLALVPRIAGLAFDAVLVPEGGSATELLRLSLLLLAVVLVRGVIDLAGMVLAIENLAQRFERNARSALTISLLGKSQAFHNRQRVGDIMARAANDVRQLNYMISPGMQLIVDSILGLVVPLVFIAGIESRLLLFPLLFVVGFYFAIRHYQKRLDPVSIAMRQDFGTLNAGLTETITGIELVKAASQEEQERGKFLKDATRYRDSFIRHGEVQARYLPILLIGIAMTATFAQGLLLLAQGQITVGGLVAVVGLVGSLRGPAGISIFTFSLVQLGMAAAGRILELINATTELDENRGGHVARVRGELAFENVGFGYGGADGRAVLSGVNFRAEPGETIAIVGQTGSGKSTLTRLVNRTYDVGEGRILIDGIDVRDWSMESLRQQISVIEQDVFLFSRSVADNIAFGLPGASREQVIAAAKAAQAHEFITQFPEGYETVIGERGMTLSGGQRQRLAIARALLTDPRILVLDDATSAIDSATEDAIQKAIATVLEGRTALVITHRLSQIRRADRIVVLDESTVLEQGTHDELLERCALYRRIFARFD